MSTTSGLMTTRPEELYAQTIAASRAGFQTCIHAIGDHANRIVLDTFERVQGEVPGSRNLRMRDEHAQILARRLLADELVEALRPQRGIGIFGRALGRSDSGGVGGHQSECSTFAPTISTQ